MDPPAGGICWNIRIKVIGVEGRQELKFGSAVPQIVPGVVPLRPCLSVGRSPIVLPDVGQVFRIFGFGCFDPFLLEPLKDLSRFTRFRVDPEMQTLVWENGADMAPEFLYDKMNVLA